jgi:hypothetical protein
VIALAGAARLVGSGLDAADPPPVHPVAAIAATSRTIHRRRRDVTFCNVPRGTNLQCNVMVVTTAVVARQSFLHGSR